MSGPLRGRMGGHGEVNHAPALMGQHQKHVQGLKPNGRHREEVYGNEALEMILQERSPGLGGRPSAAHQVLAHAGLDTELEQFSVNTRCARVYLAELSRSRTGERPSDASQSQCRALRSSTPGATPPTRGT